MPRVKQHQRLYGTPRVGTPKIVNPTIGFFNEYGKTIHKKMTKRQLATLDNRVSAYADRFLDRGESRRDDIEAAIFDEIADRYGIESEDFDDAGSERGDW